MTIEEIKSVSIYNWMKENNYGTGSIKGKNVFYCSPLRLEKTPSFVVNTKDNLWYDFGTGRGGNLISLVERLNPSWTMHEVLGYLEKQIKEKRLQFNEDYNARILEEEKKRQWFEGKRSEYQENHNHETVVDMISPLTHPILRDYIIQRRIDFTIAQKYCREVHYSFRGKRYYAIAFMNVVNGMEARNKLSKRCIGKKSISAIYPKEVPQKRCCIFEGFFDMLAYKTLYARIPDNGVTVIEQCDFFVLNGVGEVRVLLPYLKEYDSIHCFLDNDEAGRTATKEIAKAYPGISIDESYRYQSYNDLNDFLLEKK